VVVVRCVGVNDVFFLDEMVVGVVGSVPSMEDGAGILPGTCKILAKLCVVFQKGTAFVV